MRQLDLFAGAGERADPPVAPGGRPPVAPAELDDAALVAAVPHASLGVCRGLADEAGRRRLMSAIPALEALCRRFKGFGVEERVPEQEAALAALAAIGGRAAAEAVRRLVIEGVVQGPGVEPALEAVARLGVVLPDNVLAPLFEQADAQTRAACCRCAGPSPIAAARLVELLDDPYRDVATEAACALGRMGRSAARPFLVRLLREAPSGPVIDAAILVADEECLVILGRIARTRADLAEAALAALDAVASPRALQIAAGARQSPASNEPQPLAGGI